MRPGRSTLTEQDGDSKEQVAGRECVPFDNQINGLEYELRNILEKAAQRDGNGVSIRQRVFFAHDICDQYRCEVSDRDRQATRDRRTCVKSPWKVDEALRVSECNKKRSSEGN